MSNTPIVSAPLADDPITWEDPAVRLWTSSGKNYIAKPGMYNCPRPNCQNTTFPINSVAGMWVPPNKYVWAYTGYASSDTNSITDDVFSHAVDIISEYPKSVVIPELSYNVPVQVCQADEQILRINKAVYRSAVDSSKVIDVAKNRNILKFVGDNKIVFQKPLNDLLGDPHFGNAKVLELDLSCGKAGAFVIYGVQPQGVYGPGQYDTLATAGEYDQLVPDVHANRGGRIRPNDIDTLTVREIRPWRDHLKDCCLGSISDPKLCGVIKPGYSKCAEFQPPTPISSNTVNITSTNQIPSYQDPKPQISQPLDQILTFQPAQTHLDQLPQLSLDQPPTNQTSKEQPSIQMPINQWWYYLLFVLIVVFIGFKLGQSEERNKQVPLQVSEQK